MCILKFLKSVFGCSTKGDIWNLKIRYQINRLSKFIWVPNLNFKIGVYKVINPAQLPLKDFSGLKTIIFETIHQLKIPRGNFIFLFYKIIFGLLKMHRLARVEDWPSGFSDKRRFFFSSEIYLSFRINMRTSIRHKI